MFRDVITRTTKPGDWPRMREEIRIRLLGSMGQMPKVLCTKPVTVVRRYSAHGLAHEDITFEILPGYTCAGVMVMPMDAGKSGERRPGAVCIHGTNQQLARLSMLSPEKMPNRAYAIELAQRGFVCISVDQFGFGDWSREKGEAALYEKFFHEFPGWSLDGARLYTQQCAVDILTRDPRVDVSRIACIGNSLGGRASAYLAAFDERVGAAVVSTGVSPNLTNVYRNRTETATGALSPLLNAAILKNGKTPWDYEELLALIAPRALIHLEPFNDPGNPYIEATVECYLKARTVFELLDCPENATMVCHGAGHDTPPEMRQYAYALIEKALGAARSGS